MDFTTEQEATIKLPKFRKLVELSAGEKLTDDVDLVEFAQRTVPTGKKVKILVNIAVIELENE